MFNIQILTIICFMSWMSKRCQEKKHTNKDRKRGCMIQSSYHICILLSRRTFPKINTIETFWECLYMPMMLSITCVDDWNSKIFLQFYLFAKLWYLFFSKHFFISFYNFRITSRISFTYIYPFYVKFEHNNEQVIWI